MRRRLRAAALLAGLWLAALTGIQAQVSPGVVEKVVVTGRWTLRHTAAYGHDSDSEPAIAAHNIHDLTLVWTLANDSLTFDATILNLTDREPPRVYRQLNYDPLTHNPLGRLVEVGLRWRM